jgi:hypothetical protein
MQREYVQFTYHVKAHEPTLPAPQLVVKVQNNYLHKVHVYFNWTDQRKTDEALPHEVACALNSSFYDPLLL